MLNVLTFDPGIKKKRYVTAPAKGEEVITHRITGIPENNCYLNLIRRTVIAVLANHGFITRELLVDQDKRIAVLLSLPEDIIRNEADILGFPKFVAFGMADLMSLEPVDKKGRPLRLNQVIYDESAWNMAYKGQMVAEKSRELRKAIYELLMKDCNMKKIIRLSNAVWMEPKEGDFSTIYSHAYVPLSDWEKYHTYLVEVSTHAKCIQNLKQKITVVREAFYGDNRFVKRGNNSRNIIDRSELMSLTNRLMLRTMRVSLKKSGLNSIWEKIRRDPLEYSFSYQCPDTNMRPRTRILMEMVWAEHMWYFPPEDDSEDEDGKPKPKHPRDGQLNFSKFTKTEALRVGFTKVG